jgi:hypothetical protein
MTGRIVQINVSPGGVPKHPVGRARVTWMGIDHRNTEHHGGPDRALLDLLDREEAERCRPKGIRSSRAPSGRT